MKKNEPKLKYFAVKVMNGQLAVDTDMKKYLYKKFLESLEGMECWLSLDPRIPKRSDRQNRYYRLYLSIIADCTGNDIDTLHSWAKGKFLTSNITEVYGDKVRVTRSTTELTKSEFVEYLMQIEAETGIPAPDPKPFKLALSWGEWDTLKTKQKQYYQSNFSGTKILDLVEHK